MLSMHREARASTLAALREIYDGSWTRHVGIDGGKSLEWHGRIGLIAGCTPTIDSHHSVTASLGERFLSVRLRDAGTVMHAKTALAHAGRETTMREEMTAAVRAFFAGLDVSRTTPGVSDEERDALVQLSALVCRCRAPVERDAFRREIELLPGPESPTRLAVSLLRLFGGLVAMQTPRERAWRVIRRVALDSMPALRRAVLETLAPPGEWSVTDVAAQIGYPTITTRRTLEDLAAYELIHRKSGGSGKTDRWTLGDPERELLATLSGTSGDTAGEQLHSLNHLKTALEDFSERVPNA